jgi:hypothetical protein
MITALPSKLYVTLSEALTWIAFSNVQDRVTLNKELAEPAFGMELGSAKARLEDALVSLMDAACAGKVELRGKYLPSGQSSADEEKTHTIPATEFENYRQFDLTEDALRFGSGLAWLPDKSYTWQYVSHKRPEFYTNVTASRSGLMHTFSARRAGLPAIEKGELPRLSEADLQLWWGKLTPQERALSQAKLEEMCLNYHPDHRVVRTRIRILTPGRQRGPKTKGP